MITEERETAIKIEHVSKQYRLGAIGGTTLREDLHRVWARMRRKEDPTVKIGHELSPEKMGTQFLALDDISLEIKKGESVGIIGRNGAGKSTLLKLLSRVTGPTEGTISYNGRITSMLEVGTGFHPELTGRENIYLNGAILGMTRYEIDDKIEEIIEFSEIRQFIDTPVKRYSSGMYVKLAFSVASHLDSDIIVMDEVLAVGDMAFQKKCLSKMRESVTADGKTVLYVSHNMNTIRELCSRCIVLDRGHLIFDGDVEEGISLYMGDKDISAAYVDVNVMERPNDQYGKPVRLTAMHIADHDSWVIRTGEKLSFDFEVSALENVDRKLSLRIRVFNYNGQPVTIFQAFYFEDALKKGEKAVYRAEVDTECLVPGRYYFCPGLFFSDEHNESIVVDEVKDIYSVCLQIQKNPGFNHGHWWRSSFGGAVLFPDMRVEKTGASL
jgi:lipopolysaccharide transport system ATP-binding protein